MRIGLVLFGHLRSFRSTNDSYKQFLITLRQAGDVDVFCHTWDIEESVTPSWWKEHKENAPPPATVEEKEIVARYQPKAFQIEPSINFDEPDFNIKMGTPLVGMISMLYSQRKAFELLKKYEQTSNIRYDVVIKTRYDLLYEISESFGAQVKLSMENNCLYLPSSNPYELAGAYSDIFAMGPGHLMDKYFDFNRNTKAAVDLYLLKGYKELVPELLLVIFLQQQNISINELKGLRIHILRMNGHKFQINTCKDFDINSPLCFYALTADKCRQLLKNNPSRLLENEVRVTKKYVSWIDTDANDELLDTYAHFKAGTWMSLKETKELARRANVSKVFTPNVMKEFFESAIMNAKYGALKMLLQATTLARNGYGTYYFKVIRKKMASTKIIKNVRHRLLNTGNKILTNY